MTTLTDMPDILPDEEEARKKTAGEVLFDRTVYTGIGLGVNEAGSLWVTDQFTHGKNLLEHAPAPLKRAGKWFSREGYEALSEALVKTFRIKDQVKGGVPVTAQAHASNMLLMGALFVAGSLLVWPIKKIEDKRLTWVTKGNHLIDRLRGRKLSPEETAARDAEVEQAVACLPKQSWPTLLAGRSVAMFSSWATGTFMIGAARNRRLMQGAEQGLTGLVEGANTATGGHAHSPLAQLARSDRFKRYAGLSAVETYSCTISAVVLEMMSKLFARRGTLVHNPELCNAIPQPEAKTSTPDEEENGCRTSHCRKIREAKALTDAAPVMAR